MHWWQWWDINQMQFGRRLFHRGITYLRMILIVVSLLLWRNWWHWAGNCQNWRLGTDINRNCLSLPLFMEKYQTHHVKRWNKYLREWTSDPNKVGDIVRSVRNASTWKVAALKLQQLPGVGPYSSSQAICTVFLGVLRSEGLFVRGRYRVRTGIKILVESTFPRKKHRYWQRSRNARTTLSSMDLETKV